MTTTTQQVVVPSGDPSGQEDTGELLAGLATGYCVMGPSSPTRPFIVNPGQILGHENEYIMPAGIGRTFVKLTYNGPAFKWTPADPAKYVGNAGGGILFPGLTVMGPGGITNPTDGSCAAQMADIPNLRACVQAIQCQYALLSDNEYYWTERARFDIHPIECHDPVVMACAATGQAGRSGSFDRTRVEVNFGCWLGDAVGGDAPPMGPGGVQLLRGAAAEEGSIEQYGNFSGTGQNNLSGEPGVYALYLSGQTPADALDPGVPTCFEGGLIAGIEYDGDTSKGAAPGSLFLDAHTSLTVASGRLQYGAFGPAWVDPTAHFAFSGPVNDGQDRSILRFMWDVVTTSLHPGFGGKVLFKPAQNLSGLRGAGQGGQMCEIVSRLNIQGGTVINPGDVLFTVPAGLFFDQDTNYVTLYLIDGTGVGTPVCVRIKPTGEADWLSPPITIPGPSTQTSWLYGSDRYPLVV